MLVCEMKVSEVDERVAESIKSVRANGWMRRSLRRPAEVMEKIRYWMPHATILHYSARAKLPTGKAGSRVHYDHEDPVG